VAEDVAAPGWRSIDELADLVGAYAWMDQRIFSITGAFATAPSVDGDGAGDGTADGAGDGTAAARVAEARVWCAAVSRRHGARAAQWEARLPVRAGVDALALVRPPTASLDGALDALAGTPDLLAGLAAIVVVWLPALGQVYGAHLRAASPVREGSVLEVLAGAHRDLTAEVRAGRALLGGVSEALPGAGGDLCAELERAFAGWRIFPAVWPS
jgi:hypothetical protein